MNKVFGRYTPFYDLLDSHDLIVFSSLSHCWSSDRLI